MEGLIPKIYRSLKRSKTLRHHKNSQQSTIQNIEDFYPDGYNFRYDLPLLQQQQFPKITDGLDTKNKSMQRRQKSYRRARYWPEESRKKSKSARFGSQRRMFSCITGA